MTDYSDLDSMTDAELRGTSVSDMDFSQEAVEAPETTLDEVLTVDEASSDNQYDEALNESPDGVDTGEQQESQEAPEELVEDAEEVSDTDTTEDEPEAVQDRMQALLDKPFKVGDAEFKLSSAEEVETLLRKGIGANKRMQELQPELAKIAMLKANGLLDTDKLNYLIALDKKDPEAIKQLVQSSGVDAFELTTEDASKDWKPEDHSVTSNDMELENQFGALEGSQFAQATTDSIGKLDSSSKAYIRDNPKVVGNLHEMHAEGQFNDVQGIVAKGRSMGSPEFNGLSEVEAYNYVWTSVKEHLASNPGMGEAVSNNGTNGQDSAGNLVGSSDGSEAGHKQQTDKLDNSATGKARAAAQSTRKGSRTSSASSSKPINLDNLSNEEIQNLSFEDYMRSTG